VKVAVAMATYRRALPYLLTSVASQTRKPEEEVIALKPSGDSSEEVMRSFSSQLPIKLVAQGRGNFTDAVQMAIDNAKGNVILFLDDDAVAEKRWVEKYENLTPPAFLRSPKTSLGGGAKNSKNTSTSLFSPPRSCVSFST
jgi:glycosyltransferase involved in cell wall biosynthesis